MNNLPTSFAADKTTEFEPGQIGQIEITNDNDAICHLSDGTASFGIIDGLGNSDRITVWHRRGLFETDQYDTTQLYREGDSLFAGRDGRLTTQQKPEQQEVAICTTAPTAAALNLLTFLWLGKELPENK
jgi:hypothetical protein